MNKVFMSGNHAFAEAAIRAGCRCYFGYPITPQNELGEYMADHMRRPRAASSYSPRARPRPSTWSSAPRRPGARAMTSSSSPGISLKQEGISFLAGFELPGGHRERDARRPGPGQHRAGPGRLLPGDARRRPRRLPHPGLRAGVGAGDRGPHLSRLRRGGPVPHARS